MFTVMLCIRLLDKFIVYQIDGHLCCVPDCWASLLCIKLIRPVCTKLMDSSMFTVMLCTSLLGLLGKFIVYHINGLQYVHSTVVYRIVGPVNCVPN